MKTTIQDIFREIYDPTVSLAMVRRNVAEVAVKFNGHLVTSMSQEFDVKQGDVFAVGKKWEWIRGTRGKDGPECWVTRKFPSQDDEKEKGIADHEGRLRLGAYYLVFPKHPAPCDYVRIVNSFSLIEIVYWSATEWAEAPEEVMGAIIGALCEGMKYG